MTCQQYLGVQLDKSSSLQNLLLVDDFSGPMVAILQQILKSSTTFPELELKITHDHDGFMEVFSDALPLIAKGLQSNRSL
jgi:hypothetical protein